jgi:hypothetical protein
MDNGRIVGVEGVAGESILQRRMAEAPEKGKELLHSAHANRMNG